MPLDFQCKSTSAFPKTLTLSMCVPPKFLKDGPLGIAGAMPHCGSMGLQDYGTIGLRDRWFIGLQDHGTAGHQECDMADMWDCPP